MINLIIKNSQHPSIAPNDWSLGWRITLKDGTKHDMIWGSIRPNEEALKKIIAEERARGKVFEIEDERTKPKNSN